MGKPVFRTGFFPASGDFLTRRVVAFSVVFGFTGIISPLQSFFLPY
jgi:hypothetical protein